MDQGSSLLNLGRGHLWPKVNELPAATNRHGNPMASRSWAPGAPGGPWGRGLQNWGAASMPAQVVGATSPLSPPWHSPLRCRWSGHGLRHAGPPSPGTAVGGFWWPRLGSGCQQGRGGSQYLGGQRDGRMNGGALRDAGARGLLSSGGSS